MNPTTDSGSSSKYIIGAVFFVIIAGVGIYMMKKKSDSAIGKPGKGGKAGAKGGIIGSAATGGGTDGSDDGTDGDTTTQGGGEASSAPVSYTIPDLNLGISTTSKLAAIRGILNEFGTQSFPAKATDNDTAEAYFVIQLMKSLAAQSYGTDFTKQGLQAAIQQSTGFAFSKVQTMLNDSKKLLQINTGKKKTVLHKHADKKTISYQDIYNYYLNGATATS